MTTAKPTVEKEQPPEPAWTPNGVPNCSEECRHHDGKRCGLMGLRAPDICEPTVEGMAAERIAMRDELATLREQVREAGEALAKLDAVLDFGIPWATDDRFTEVSAINEAMTNALAALSRIQEGK